MRVFETIFVVGVVLWVGAIVVWALLSPVAWLAERRGLPPRCEGVERTDRGYQRCGAFLDRDGSCPNARWLENHDGMHLTEPLAGQRVRIAWHQHQAVVQVAVWLLFGLPVVLFLVWMATRGLGA